LKIDTVIHLPGRPGKLLKEAEVEKLVLTHLSRRYRADRAKEVEQRSQKKVFENTFLGEDGRRFEIKPHRPES